jgi:hypothetical protein
MKTPPTAAASVDEHDALLAAVVRLSRPHPSGGRVIERAAVLAAGPDAARILRWVTRYGEAEARGVPTGHEGIHGRRGLAAPADRQPLRYVLPVAALSASQAPPDGG